MRDGFNYPAFQTVDKVGVGIYSQHHFSLYNQYFDSFLKI